MKALLTALSILFSISCFSQTVAELELDLRRSQSGERFGNKKEQAFKLLQLDKFNEKAINYLVRAYSQNKQKDSIQWLYDKLIKENPNRPEPYIIRAGSENSLSEGVTAEQQISYLKKALEIDRTHAEAKYMLGKSYYDLFVKEYRADKNSSKLTSYANQALEQFDAVCKQKESYKETLKYPSLQLAHYLADANKIKLYEQYNVQTTQIPISAFMSIPADWQTNYAVNVMDYVSRTDSNFSGVQFAVFFMNWYSKHLTALEEPALNDSSTTKVYRFTWLRSFDHPVAIRLENKKDRITLYWKVCDGTGGYEPGKLVTDKKKDLSIKEWALFQQKIDSIQFWNAPTIDNSRFGTDGARWILEGKESGKYHMVDRWTGQGLKLVCLDLLKMTDLEENVGRIY
ncbi:MAG: hypothetical protein PHI48_03740 [Bacteroidales bacterium]|nr:hypothetical protein [Bacteroidales bacterium]